MVEATLVEVKHEEKLSIPEFDVEGKENIDQYFKLLLAGTPRLRFSIVKGKKELYSNTLNVEMR
ncbi:MAG: hypothetical protein R3255_03500 [Candidatus Lokiarchaeia archaeon]|nr:hypothetical protein [Candidatus Lokiarchaeia archaeon]